MGWDYVRMEVHGHVSRHNSEQDVTDDGLWEEFCTRVALIVREHRYEKLDLTVYGAQIDGV